MSWNEARSRKRIEEHLKTVPIMDDDMSLTKQRQMFVEARSKGLMDRMSCSRAFVIEGAHMYGQLLDFEDLVLDSEGYESEASHDQLLRLLDAHYRLWDSIVENENADRVDYHGARMHAVVSTPGEPAQQIERAVALAVRLGSATRKISASLGYETRIRFGIDQGKCVALTTGRAHERDTLFLGTPANHAAKLAAEEDEEGIYLSPTSELAIGEASLVQAAPSGIRVLTDAFINKALERNPLDWIDRTADRLIAQAGNERKFVFFRPQPPLSSLKFSDLSPSKSARSGMASLFADIDGFTAFVDTAIRQGGDAVKRAARNIHVIREELNDVLKDDFGGKRVRFIGDCIQGVVSEGAGDDDGPGAVRQAALCASGMRSSFKLCQEVLGDLDDLDLAVGIEYGPVPLTRIGLRGEDSVRCATGLAVVLAEKVQQGIERGGVDLGANAYQLAGLPVRRHFAEAVSIPSYDAAVDLLALPSSPSIRTVQEHPEARSHAERS